MCCQKLSFRKPLQLEYAPLHWRSTRHHVGIAINILVAMFRVALHKRKELLQAYSSLMLTMLYCHWFVPTES